MSSLSHRVGTRAPTVYNFDHERRANHEGTTETLSHYDDLSKANLLNKYFSSVFTKNQYTDDVINNDSGICIGSFYFNENHIKILIEKLNICKAAGPDGIHAKVIMIQILYLSIMVMKKKKKHGKIHFICN